MPPRLPKSLAAASARCSSFFVAPVTQRFAVASLHSTASLSGPRQLPPSSGASFLNLDSESGRAQPADGSSPSTASASASASTSSSSPSSAFTNSLRAQGPRYMGARSATNSDANAALSSVLFDSEARRLMYERREERKRSTLERMAERKVSEDYARHMPRRWNQGDVYAPHDLSHAEARKWKKAAQPTEDIVDMLGINPLDEYRNFRMISDFMTTMGRIRPAMDTALRPVNQRRMAKAIRRAIGLGIHPSVHKHPEILAASMVGLPKPSYTALPENRKKSFRA
ncbi:hypothetical protein SCUCBS95973_003367 [Sporothrix curviconia]|uniref:Small ribosomal subunit protein bS18m n=1 Tax=Sporothrix curviconia TaxID=1260050 RepID=A0ABP0BEQ3_9PEZI